MHRRLLASAAALLVATCLGAAEGGHGDAPLRLGVVSFYNPRLMYLKYQPLVDYLAARTGKKWELRLNTSYQDTVGELCSGAVQLAYLGPLAYLRARAACEAVPAVHLRTRGKDTYRGFIMVRADSPVHALRELVGKRVGFGAPLATSSYLAARALLEDAGVRVGSDVACRHYAQHEGAARAVVLGEADACAVRDIVGEKFLSRGLRILAESEPLPNFALVVAASGVPQLRDEVVRALVIVPRVDPYALETISSWDEELAGGFGIATDSEFDGVLKMARRIFGPAALTLDESALACGSGAR